MKSYPITMHRTYYNGADPKRRSRVNQYNQAASRIETYLNNDLSKLPDDTVKVYDSYKVAVAIEEDSQTVQDIIFKTDGGTNGITIVKGDYSRAMASRSRPS